MVSDMSFSSASVAAAIALLLAGAASASELVYQPKNPSFGGNPFNSSHLLGIANAQNDYDAPRSSVRPGSSIGDSQADLFVRQLQSRLLSGLATQVTDAIFGPNPQERGTIRFGSQEITFVRGLESIALTIFDADTGTTTEVSVPVLQIQ